MSEARLILEAVATDFAALPGVRVLTLSRRGEFTRAFREALAEAGGALIIAPERDGILLRLTRSVERAGIANLGCDSKAVRR